MTKIGLATEHKDIFYYLQEVELLDNENAVELLIKRYKIPHINLNSEAIKAVDFEKMNDYCQNDYFIFEDIKGDRCCAINNISIIQKKISNFLQNTKIFLVREVDFYSILERDFAVDNTLNAIECLTNINPKDSAKSINYPKIVMGFLTIFFATVFFALNNFSLLNNILYFVQNLFKAVLFGRSLWQHNSSEEVEITKVVAPIDLSDNLPI